MLILAFLLLAFGAGLIYVRFCGFVIWKACPAVCGLFFCPESCFISVVVWVARFITQQSHARQNSCAGWVACMCYLLTGYGWVRTHVRGLEKLPEPGRFLLVCNHRSMFDPAVIVRKLGKFNISFVSKPSNMKIPIFGAMGYGAGYLPIDRENDRKGPGYHTHRCRLSEKGHLLHRHIPGGDKKQGREIVALPCRLL